MTQVGLAILVLPAWKWYILPGLHSAHDAKSMHEGARVVAIPVPHQLSATIGEC